MDQTGSGWCPLHVFGIVCVEVSDYTKHFTSVGLILNQNIKRILHISKFASWSHTTTSRARARAHTPPPTHTHTHTHPHTLTLTRTWTECSRAARHILACESGALRIETSSLLAVTKTLFASEEKKNPTQRKIWYRCHSEGKINGLQTSNTYSE